MSAFNILHWRVELNGKMRRWQKLNQVLRSREQVGDMKGATLRIEAPESARRPVTTVTVDHKPSASCAGVEVHIEGELALERGEVSQTLLTSSA